MPELPEVETIRRGLVPVVEGRRIARVEVRERRLRWPVPGELEARLAGRTVRALERRGKYLLWRVDDATLVVHLGMSGALRLVSRDLPVARHDHIDLALDGGTVVRFSDPRRFGCWLLVDGDAGDHPLLRDLGPEPLSADFDGAVLWRALRGRSVAIKLAIMDSRVVVGVGNIYASESLFAAGVHPGARASSLSRARATRLAQAVREVLGRAIAAGGTTLRDGGFAGSDGAPGYFARSLAVYDRAGQPCPRCGGGIRQAVLGGRSTYWCGRCQR